MNRLAALRDELRESLWFIPGLFALAATIAALVLVAVDQALAEEGGAFPLFAGSPDGARAILSTIAASMLTFTALVFSITMLVLQLASSQLSPRVMRTFLRDRNNQVVLGLFIATFLYTLLVLRDVRSPTEGEPFVPALAVWVAIVLAVASVAAFIHYIHHMAHAIQAGTVVRSIGRETRQHLDRIYPQDIGRDAADGAGPTVDRAAGAVAALVRADQPGTLKLVDGETLLKAADDAGLVAEVLLNVGDFVPEGAPLVRVWGSPHLERDWGSLEETIRKTLTIGEGRSMEQDAAFGFRQLVDVATRALSPGTNDPTTAVEAINELHDLLRRLATRAIPSPLRADEQGRLRLILPRPGWDEYIHLAIDELRVFGEGQLQIARRLRFLLEDLETVCPPEGRPVLADEILRLDRSVDRGFADEADRALARRSSADRRGVTQRPIA